MILPSKFYNTTKYVVLIALPAFATLYLVLGNIWGLPKIDEVVGTCTAVATFLGALVGISSKSYNNSDVKYDGEMVFDEDDDGQSTVQHRFNEFPEELKEKKEVVLKVVNAPSSDLAA